MSLLEENQVDSKDRVTRKKSRDDRLTRAFPSRVVNTSKLGKCQKRGREIKKSRSANSRDDERPRLLYEQRNERLITSGKSRADCTPENRTSTLVRNCRMRLDTRCKSEISKNASRNGRRNSFQGPDVRRCNKNETRRIKNKARENCKLSDLFWSADRKYQS